MESGSTIRTGVIEELEFDTQLPADGIGVAASDGVVTLSGHVADFARKIAAANAAQRPREVKGVGAGLVVRLQCDDRLDDN